MSTDEVFLRRNIVACARSWIGTPYELGQSVRGAGTDCYQLIASVLHECGVIDREVLPVYSHDWWCHHSEQSYILRLTRYATRVFQGMAYASTPMLAGNIVSAKQAGGKAFWHGGIITEWPWLIHSVYEGVEEVSAMQHPLWVMHEVQVFDPFMNKDALERQQQR